MNSLTEEEKKYIINLYGGSKRIINTIETLINSTELYLSHEDYIYLIKECVSLYTTLIFRDETKNSKIKYYITIGEIVKYYINQYIEEFGIQELDEYYDERLFDEYPENHQK